MEHYRLFVKTMDATLSKDAESQTQIMSKIFEAEESFKAELISSNLAEQAYNTFIKMINEEKGNVLCCRIYFRERQNTFTRQMFCLFKKNPVDPKDFYHFKINYQFILFCFQRGISSRKLKRIAKKIEDLRREMVQTNLPSVIHSARIFWDKMNYTHLSFMDFVQNAAEGFISAVDKYEPPYQKNFGSVVTNRMKLYMAIDHNSTLIKIEQQKKRLLYRAKKAKHRMRVEEPDQAEIGEITAFVQESFSTASKENVEEVLAAAKTLSMDSKVEMGGVPLADSLPDDTDVEAECIQQDLMHRLAHALRKIKLSVLDRKILLLKFGAFESISP